MKTIKTYITPKCSVYRLKLNGKLCINLFSSEVGYDEEGAPIIGAKRGQYVFDDEAEENPDYDL